MIAADTSTWIAFGDGLPGEDCDRLLQALNDEAVRMPPPVFTELYSVPKLRPGLAGLLASVTEMALIPGYWRRAGELRALVLGQGRKARLGDALIAQCCLDHNVPLLTRDHDFRAFAAAAGLKLLLD